MTNFSNKTLLSAPCYMETNSTGYMLIGFVNVLVDFKTIIFQPRAVVQNGIDIAVTNGTNRTIVDAWLYNHTTDGIQILEQDDYLYMVENQPVDERVCLRVEAPLDRVLGYSTSVALEPGPIAPLDISAAGQVGFELEFRGRPALLFANASLLGEAGDAAALRALVTSQRYTTAVRLILEEIYREQSDSARYNETGEGLPLMIKPAVFCTADKGICGATPTVLQRRDETAYTRTALYELLVGMHDPDRLDSLFQNYTRLVHAEDLKTWLVVQRHYVSMSIGTIYANATLLVRFVCTPLMSMGKYCTGPEDHDSYALFVNYDGVIGYGEAVIEGVAYGPESLQNVSLFEESTLLEAKLLVEHNNLTRGNRITFLTEHLKNAQIYELELVPYQNGTGAYEQFEGSYLFLCASIARDVRARPEII